MPWWKHPPPAGDTLFIKEGKNCDKLMLVHIVFDGIAHLVGETQYIQSSIPSFAKRVPPAGGGCFTVTVSHII